MIYLLCIVWMKRLKFGREYVRGLINLVFKNPWIFLHPSREFQPLGGPYLLSERTVFSRKVIFLSTMRSRWTRKIASWQMQPCIDNWPLRTISAFISSYPCDRRRLWRSFLGQWPILPLRLIHHPGLAGGKRYFFNFPLTSN